jgi:hypothetical protein
MEFLTTTSPSYTNLRKVRLEIGGFLGDLADATIQTSILEASLEADVLTFAPGRVNTALYLHARREYTTCSASSLLLHNLVNASLKAKTLGDLSVQYDTNGIRDATNRVRDCMEKWIPQLMAGGGAKAAKNPSFVVKGELDPDRQVVSRMWHSTDHGGVGNRIPAANDRLAHTSKNRRALRTYTPNKTKKWW